MTKRGKRISLIVVGALVVALVALAFVFREQPPYEFLRGAERLHTFVMSDPNGSGTAFVTYVSDRSAADIGVQAGEELYGKDSDQCVTYYNSPNFERGIQIYTFGDVDVRLKDESLRGKTGVHVRRPATATDRFHAWLDRVTGR